MLTEANNGDVDTDADADDDDDALPVYAPDVVAAYLLQITNMRGRLGGKAGQEKVGGNFVTLAMGARTGSCKAFQMSDVAVQMVSKGGATIVLPQG